MDAATAAVSLVFLQAFGALAGSFAVVWGEFSYIRAMRDGKIETAERAHLDSIAAALRFGMMLVLLSSLGLVVTAYFLESATPPALSPSYWIVITLSLLIVWASWALSRKRVSFTYGSALVFTAWWFLSYLTLGWLPLLTFGSAIAAFVIAVALFYALLVSARFLALRKG